MLILIETTSGQDGLYLRTVLLKMGSEIMSCNRPALPTSVSNCVTPARARLTRGKLLGQSKL